MCKKISLGVLGLALIAGLLFGGKLIPYAQTAYSKMRDAANDRVPVEFQIDAAKTQLNKIGPEIQGMVHQIAKEKVQINRLEDQIVRQETALESSYSEMMTLRDHLKSDNDYYVATDNREYSRERVEEDLRHRLKMYKTGQETLLKQKEILSHRLQALETAQDGLSEAKKQQRELETQIEQLIARNRMNEVAATASKLDFDDSQLSRTREMIDSIDAKISAKEEVLSMSKKHFGQIPVGESTVDHDVDILKELDALRSTKSSDKDTVEFNVEL